MNRSNDIGHIVILLVTHSYKNTQCYYGPSFYLRLGGLTVYDYVDGLPGMPINFFVRAKSSVKYLESIDLTVAISSFVHAKSYLLSYEYP